MEDNRRNFIKKGTAFAALSVVGIGSASSGLLDLNDSKSIIESKTSTQSIPQKKVQWPVTEGPDTPKLCMNCSLTADEKGMRRVKQLGINYVLMDGPRIPWKDGYYPVEGRGGSGYLGFNYDHVRNLPPEPETGIHSAEELWDNLTYFLKAVIPVAEKAGVRMALHPNE